MREETEREVREEIAQRQQAKDRLTEELARLGRVLRGEEVNLAPAPVNGEAPEPPVPPDRDNRWGRWWQK